MSSLYVVETYGEVVILRSCYREEVEYYVIYKKGGDEYIRHFLKVIVPLDEDIDEYFEREVIPYNPNAWIDKKKTKVGYEIPFTRTFYEYKQIEPSDVIAARIEEHEKSLMAKLHDLFGGE